MKTYWKLGILGALVGAMILGYQLLPQRPAAPVLPSPNGYEDLLNAARKAQSERHLVYGEADIEELTDLLGKNQAALASARSGCARECRVTTDYRLSASVYAAQHLPVLAQFKKLALAFRAEGELAERRGKTNETARAYLDGVRFAQEMCRGGLLIDRMIGIATERINLNPLTNLIENLDARTCRDLAKLLEKMDTRRESIDATWKEEQIWFTRVCSFRDRLGLLVVRVIRPRDFNAPREESASKLAEVQTQARFLTLQLAMRAYQLEHGKTPERLGDLLPEYLRIIPKHPVTGKDL